MLALSSLLYENSVPPEQISWALAACSAATYLAFDGTKQGLALALLCAVACPGAEVWCDEGAGGAAGEARGDGVGGAAIATSW